MRKESHKLLKVVLLLMTIVLLSFLKVEAQSGTDSIVFSLDIDDVVITGQALPTDIQNAIHPVQLINAAEIEAKGQVQLQEVLASMPNIRLIQDPLLGTSIKMRGVSSDNVNVLIDGVPIVGRLDGGLDLSQINLSDIKRIEIIEGPMSNLYGNNAAGGVINIITRRSIASEFRMNTDHQYEHIGINNHSLSLAMQKHGFFLSLSGKYLKHQLYPLDSTRVYQSFEDQDGNSFEEEKYPWNPKEQYAANASLRYNINETGFVIYKYAHLNEEVLNPGQIQRPQFKPYAWDNVFDTRRNDHSLSYHQEFEAHVFDAVFAHNRYQRFFRTDRFNFDELAIDPSLTAVDSNLLTVNFARLHWASMKKGPLNYLLGVNYNHEIGSGDRIEDPGSSDPNTAAITDFAAFGNLDLAPTRKLLFSLSGRMSWNSVYGNNFTPALKMRWKYDDFWTLRGSWAKGFRAPTLKERYINFVDVNHFIISNPDIEAESSNNLALSLGLEKPNNDKLLSASISTYFNRIEKKIVLTEFEALKFNYQNIEDFTSYGANFSASYGNKRWKVNLGTGLGAWTTSELEDHSPSPIFDLQSGIEYHLPKGISTNLQHRYVGSEPRFVLDNNVLEESKIASYHLLDFHINKKFYKKRVHLGCGVKNILDTQAAGISGSSGTGGIGPHNGSVNAQIVNPGRSFYIKLGLEFTK